MFAILAHGDFPPWHPVLVNFTAGLVPIALLFELLGAVFKKDEFRAVGWWVLLSASVITPFTSLWGWLWLWNMGAVDYWQMPVHQWLGTFMTIALVGLAIWRGMMRRRRQVPDWRYLLALGLWMVLLFIQGELGGSMVHGRGLIVGAGEAAAEVHEHHEHREPHEGHDEQTPHHEGGEH